jgi:solute carrier family 25 carnitine/acylcarnitine transporter 20/29
MATTVNEVAEMRSAASSSIVAKSVAAGYVAGISGVIVGHPLDSIKVLLQTQPSNGVGAAAASQASTPPASNPGNVPVQPLGKNIARAAGKQMATPTASLMAGASTQMSTVPDAALLRQRQQASASVSTRSLRSLYVGISGPLVTTGAMQSLNFAMYDSLRRALHKRDRPTASKGDYLNNDALSNVAIASGIAGGVTGIFTSPLMVVKTKQQVMVWSFRRTVQDTYRANGRGLSNFFVGFGPHIYCDVLGRVVYFSTYEATKRMFMEQRASTLGEPANQKDIPVTIPERMFSAAVSGILSWAVIFPADSVRSRMYAHAVSSVGNTMSSLELAKKMYRDGGNSIRPFFRGFGVTVARAGPVAAFVLPVYDLTFEWLSKNN